MTNAPKTEVGRQLHAEGHREPDRVEVVQFVEHPAEACGPGDPDRGAERQRSADADEQRVLRGVSLEVRSRPEKMPEVHRSRIGSPKQSPE